MRAAPEACGRNKGRRWVSGETVDCSDSAPDEDTVRDLRAR